MNPSPDITWRIAADPAALPMNLPKDSGKTKMGNSFFVLLKSLGPSSARFTGSRREGFRGILTQDKFWARYDHPHMPEKFEAIEGKLFWSEEQRLHVLAMLLEAVGLRCALALCPPAVVRSVLAQNAREG